LTACLKEILPTIQQPKVNAVFGVNYESDGYAALVCSLLAYGRHCKDDIRSAKQRVLRQVIGMAGFFLGNPRFMKEEEAAETNQYLRSLQCWVPAPAPINGFGPSTDSEADDSIHDLANYASRSALLEDEALGTFDSTAFPLILSAQARGSSDTHPSLSQPSP
ncbi:MAG: hypothetical protein AN485_24410, partial [Anabaena sp. MDT14b]